MFTREKCVLFITHIHKTKEQQTIAQKSLGHELPVLTGVGELWIKLEVLKGIRACGKRIQLAVWIRCFLLGQSALAGGESSNIIMATR